MNSTRQGKIARLPRNLRHEVNLCLQDGRPGRQIVEGLNALPEVQEILDAQFGGRPITQQNLSEWRKGGYLDWLAHEQAFDLANSLAEEAEDLASVKGPRLSDALAVWVMARYSVAARQIEQTKGPEGWRLLRELCADLVKLRRGDHHAERLRIQRERWEAERGDHEWTDEELMDWALQEENIGRIKERAIEEHRRFRMVLGRTPDDPSDPTQKGWAFVGTDPKDPAARDTRIPNPGATPPANGSSLPKSPS